MWDLPKTNEATEPWIAFQSIRPLFELDESNERYLTASERMDIFRRDEFAAQKPDDEFRAFCLGGSTVQGRPYAIETSFTTWLELSLTAAEPRRSWQVINCGGVSYASYRLLPILKEVLNYEPDLIIVYSGHNEFLEERTYSEYKQAASWKRESHEWASQLRTYQLIREGWLQLSHSSNETEPDVDVLPSEVLARLDFENGLELFQRDDQWTATVEQHYIENLHRMIELCRLQNVPILIVNPVENLRDCAPFKSEFSSNTSSETQHQLTELLSSRTNSLDKPALLEQYKNAIEQDPRYALSHYRLGLTYESLGEIEQARRSFIRAKQEDVCPLRMRENMHEQLLRLCDEESIPVIDANKHFTEMSQSQITDNEWLLDHVHPTIEGHRKIADWILKAMAQQQLVKPGDGWESNRNELYEAHLATLGTAYYTHGQDRLKSLLQWTQGRAFNAYPRPQEGSIRDLDEWLNQQSDQDKQQ